MGLWRGSELSIGLDLGTSSVRMAQFERAGGRLSLRSSGEVELPSGLPSDGPEREAALMESCRRLLSQGRWQGRGVVAVLPDAQVQYKNIRLPVMPASELAEAANWEATERFGASSAEAMSFQHLCAGEVQHGDETKCELILMAVREKAVDSLMRVLEGCGLSPTAIETTPAALARCFDRVWGGGGAGDAHAVVEIGRSRTKVLIVRDGQVVFFKPIELGGATFDRAVLEHLNLSGHELGQIRRRLREEGSSGSASPDGERAKLFGSSRRQDIDEAIREALRGPAEELAREIALCLRYYAVTFRGTRPERITLAGGESFDDQLTAILAGQLDLTVETADPLSGLDLSDGSLSLSRQKPHPDWAVAIGAAMRDPNGARIGKRGAA